jgi:FkbM family methyltransferase
MVSSGGDCFAAIANVEVWPGKQGKPGPGRFDGKCVNVRPFLRKYLRSYPQWGFHPPRAKSSRPLTRIGSDYGGYFLDTAIVPDDPVIYSLGIGLDVSFDLALILQYGCTVHAFDPTPKVREWLEGQSLPPQFRFHPVGIADFDGEADFFLPPQPDFISHSMVRAPQYSDRSIKVPVITLTTAMARLGHSRIDVLKMDIEGGEYSVLADLAGKRVPVGQMCVEFHHRGAAVGVQKTREILSLLASLGFELVHVCPRFEVFTLVNSGVA